MKRRAVQALSALVLAGLLALLALIGSAWTAPLPARLHEAGSTVVTWRDGSSAHVFLAPDDRWRVPITADRVDPDYTAALVRYEDKRFWWHPGVDPVAVARAIAVNLRHGRVMTGASTLTLQLVRVLEPRPRTFRSKVIEMHRALTLELHLSKAEILDAYLTFAPYGRNLEGVEAASLAYFGHSAEALAPDEIATLLAVPQNPSVRYPAEANEERLREARDGIAAFLVEHGGLRNDGVGVEATLDEVKRAPVPTVIQRFPRYAPHLATELAAQHAPGSRIPTTLDRGLQRMVEDIVANERGELVRDGVHNGSVVVVHSASRELRAVVGNLDFWDAEHAGQMSGLRTPRSPGSALKPFIYALGIDHGLVLPETLVPDVPRSWGSYTPKNYDDRFRGSVELQTALSESLNLPFVELLDDVGLEKMLGALRGMGASSLSRTPGYYGLSLAAGGVELTPLEMAGFYATLANGGRYAPVRLHPGPEPAAVAIVSPGAAWLTSRALQLKDRPDFPTRRQLSGSAPRIAWKTGTSFGHRDAWAAGFGAEHTAVVWLGNLDYSPARALVGSEAAGPLLFDVLDAVDRNQPLSDGRPAELAQVEVCALSGRLPTHACEHTRIAFAPRSSVPTQSCTHHVALAVDVATGEALTPACRGDRVWEERSYVVWPASVRRHLRDLDRDLPSPPSYAEGCAPAGESRAPVISSPQPGMVSVLIPGIDPQEQEIPLAAESTRTDAMLSWFVDGAFLGTAPAEERMWWTPEPGSHVAVVVDETGMRSRRSFEVVWPHSR